MTQSQIRFAEVTKTFSAPGKSAAPPVTALSGITLTIPAGSITGIVGYSGAGKSTLVRLINALEKPTSGQVFIGDTEITALPESALQKVRSSIGMVFQHFNLFRSRTVAGNIAYPLRVAGWSKPDIAARVDELLGFIDLADKAKSFPQRLSGGQKQRVGIARALATRPDILLADEATSALDPETTAEVLDLLRRINREFGTTVVVITHEMSVVRELCDEVVMMEHGRVIESGTAYDVFAAPKSEVTRRFVSGATHSQPSQDTVDRLAARHPGTLITVDVRHEWGTAEIAEVLERAGIRGSVVFGGVTEVDEKSLGSLTYALTGSASSIAEVVAGLRERTHVEVQRSSAAAELQVAS